jgi:hypothetical protein
MFEVDCMPDEKTLIQNNRNKLFVFPDIVKIYLRGTADLCRLGNYHGHAFPDVRKLEDVNAV